MEQFLFQEGKEFKYQIGEVTTTWPWPRLSYKTAKEFLLDPGCQQIFSKFQDAYIYGHFLWKNFQTWDLDLGLACDFDTIDWAEVSDSLYTLYDLALNRHCLLVDITVSHLDVAFVLPTKSELSQYNLNTPLSEWRFPRISPLVEGPYAHRYVKICRMEKKIGEETTIFDYRHSPRTAKKTSILYGEYLAMIDFSEVNLHPKIISRIANSGKESLINFLKVPEFLTLEEKEFLRIQNY